MKVWPMALLLLLLAGCFYPPRRQPLARARTTVALDLPYDLAWHAVQTIVVRNGYHVIGENPAEGSIEAQQIGGFTLADADCGKIRGIGGKIRAEPDPDSSAVYDFRIEAKEPHTSIVTVGSTFTAPLHVPLHPVTNLECASRGVQEARILNEIREQALLEHRPEPTHPDIRKDAP
jgi:hypothetical protein